MNDLRVKLMHLAPIWVRARNIWCEARSESKEGMLAVDWVTLNRANDERRWPDEPKYVILQKNQFSWTRSNDPQYQLAFQPWLHDVEKWREAKSIVKAVDSGEEPDVTKGANHYLNMGLTKRMGGLPFWYDHDKVTVVIGKHVFLKL